MVLPIEHPFWIALLIGVPLGAFTALILYLRAARVAHTMGAVGTLGALRAAHPIAWTGLAVMAAVTAVITVLLYAWLDARWPSLAGHVIRAMGVGVVILLTLTAVRMRRRFPARGIVLLVVLTLLWLAVLGWLAPAALAWWTQGALLSGG